MTKQEVTYQAAGVDTAEGARAVDAIKETVHSTYRPEVVGDIGGFGGLFSIAAAKDMRCVIKLLASCSLTADGSIAVGVHPTMVPLSHPLASVSGAYNAVFVELEWADRLMFMGPGAGGRPTASAVVGDVVTAARNRVRGVPGPAPTAYNPPRVADPGTVSSRYYLRMTVKDSPGVLAQIAACLAAHGVSILLVRQEPTGEAADAPATAISGTSERPSPAFTIARIVSNCELRNPTRGLACRRSQKFKT